MAGQPIGLEALQLDFSRDLGNGELVCVIDFHGIQLSVDPETGEPVPVIDSTTGQPMVLIDPRTGAPISEPDPAHPGRWRYVIQYRGDGVCHACWLEQRQERYTECHLHGFQPRIEGSEGCAVCAQNPSQRGLASRAAAKARELQAFDYVDPPGTSVNAGSRLPDGPDVPVAADPGPAAVLLGGGGGRSGDQPGKLSQGGDSGDGARRTAEILRWAREV